MLIYFGLFGRDKRRCLVKGVLYDGYWDFLWETGCLKTVEWGTITENTLTTQENNEDCVNKAGAKNKTEIQTLGGQRAIKTP